MDEEAPMVVMVVVSILVDDMTAARFILLVSCITARYCSIMHYASITEYDEA